jgi:hypothetical protein
LLFREVARSQPHDGLHGSNLVRNQLKTIKSEEEPNSQESGAFVAVVERMVAHYAETIGGSEAGGIGRWFVSVNVPGPCQGRAEGSFITQARKTPVLS